MASGVVVRFGRGTVEVPLPHPVAVPAPPTTPRADATALDPRSLVARALGALPAPPARPLLVVPDRTRDAALVRILPALVDALVAAPGDEVPVLFASGVHAPMSDDEIAAALGPVRARVRPIAHDAARGPFVALGPDPSGGDVEVNAAVASCDALVVVSAMRLHYLAGTGGGRKMILPGIASRRTATRVHAASFDAARRARAHGTGPGTLDENPVHRAIVARLAHRPPTVGICVELDDARAIVDAAAGELLAHHAELAARHVARHTVVVDGRVTRALVGAGGAPYDDDLVQAHKALVAAAPLVADGGRVALVVACRAGFGHKDWPDALAPPAPALADALASSFSIAGQTAWSWRELCARFEVGLFSTLPPDEVARVGAVPLASADEIARFLGDAPCVVVEDGARHRYVVA